MYILLRMLIKLMPIPPSLSLYSIQINTLFRRRQWQPAAVLLPGKSHGRRSLVGCSPWGREESDMTEQLHFHFLLSRIGRRKWQPTPVFLPGESQERGSLVGCHLWGCTESDMTEVTLQHQQYFIYLLFQDSFFF